VILVANRRFESTPPLFSAPVEVTLLEFSRDLWQKKTRVYGLLVWIWVWAWISRKQLHGYGVVCGMLRLAILVEYLRVTGDGQTERRTAGHTTAAYTSLA